MHDTSSGAPYGMFGEEMEPYADPPGRRWGVLGYPPGAAPSTPS